MLIFSPHPDDEVIIGALPLRLRREWDARVVNVAVTLGSNPGRQTARRKELAAACDLLGFDCVELGGSQVTPVARQNEPGRWRGLVECVAALLETHRPAWIFHPHLRDGHPAHVGTALLVRDALALCGPLFAPTRRVETEFWHPMTHPNLLVESSKEEVAVLICALAAHAGEVVRNPYHRLLPAWMLDNVRRGAERIAGPGSAVPSMTFGTLYRAHPRLATPWLAVGESFPL